MTISALPTPPTRSDPTNFASRADAFLAALPTFADEANALAVAMNLNATTDTSSTSITIGTGAKSFTVSAGKSFQAGMYLVIADTAAPSTNSMWGQVTSYAGTALVINIISVLGSGTKTAWTISQSAPNAEFAYATNNATGKTTPVDADIMPLIDSAAGNTLKKLSWGNLKATLASLIASSSIAGAFTTLSATGAISKTNTAATNSNAFSVTGSTTGSTWGSLSNTSGSFVWGIESSAGGSILPSSSAYAAVVYTNTATPIQFGTNNTVQATLDIAGNWGFGIVPQTQYSTVKAISVKGSTGLGGQLSSGGSQDIVISGNAYLDAAAAWQRNGTGAAAQMRITNGVISWYTDSSTTGAIAFTQSLALGKGTSLALEGATSATGTGIAFPATQLASSDANTLDDYEEGTWTPSLGGTTVYTIQDGKYTKIGNMVFASAKIVINTIGTGSTTVISGLPFTATANPAYNGRGTVGYYSGLATSVVKINCEAMNNTANIAFLTATAAAATANAADPIFTSGTRIDLSLTYFV